MTLRMRISMGLQMMPPTGGEPTINFLLPEIPSPDYNSIGVPVATQAMKRQVSLTESFKLVCGRSHIPSKLTLVSVGGNHQHGIANDTLHPLVGHHTRCCARPRSDNDRDACANSQRQLFLQRWNEIQFSDMLHPMGSGASAMVIRRRSPIVVRLRPSVAVFLGIGGRKGNASWNLGFSFGQGSSQSSVSTTSVLTVPNGGFGFINNSIERPFVTDSSR